MKELSEIYLDDVVHIVLGALDRGLGDNLTDREVIDALAGNPSEKVKCIIAGLCENVKNVILVCDKATNFITHKSLSKKESTVEEYVHTTYYELISTFFLQGIKLKKNLR